MISAKVKTGFFDRPLAKSLSKARRKNLSRGGAFVRRRARSIVRKRKATSRPGQPPSAHTGEIRDIRFDYDDQTDTVVVGPVGFSGSKVPQTLEHGGPSTRDVFRGGTRERRRVQIAARPFMGPSLLHTKTELGPVWANSIRG